MPMPSVGNWSACTCAAGMLFYLFVYTLMNIGAFAVVISVSNQSEESQRLDDYAGLGRLV